MADDEDRKHDATPKRREQFRKEGRIARARDAGPTAAALAALVALIGTHAAARQSVTKLFTACFSDVSALTRGEAEGIRATAGEALLSLVVPPVIAASLGAIVLGAAQSGISLNWELAGFKMDRLDPMGRIKQMFSVSHGGTELLLALVKVTVVGVVVYTAAKEELPALLTLGGADFRASGEVVLATMVHLALNGLFATAVVALIDYGQSRFRLEKEMKMTLKELKDEMKAEDGDPHIKAKIRARARQMARKRMMTDVKQAAVVVTNPTHVAVALRYDNKDPAPIVVAKGHDEVALAIRREARKHGIPIVENRRLARAIDAEVAIGKPVKVEHFAAVARVLAYVFRLRKNKPRAASPAARP